MMNRITKTSIQNEQLFNNLLIGQRLWGYPSPADCARFDKVSEHITVATDYWSFLELVFDHLDPVPGKSVGIAHTIPEYRD